MTLGIDDGRTVEAHFKQLRHLDHGYASTSHSSQGTTVDRVLVNVDTRRSAELVNRKQFYVSISRAQHAISLYTDDRSRLATALRRDRDKSLALQYVKTTPEYRIKYMDERRLRSLDLGHGVRR